MDENFLHFSRRLAKAKLNLNQMEGRVAKGLIKNFEEIEFKRRIIKSEMQIAQSYLSARSSGMEHEEAAKRILPSDEIGILARNKKEIW